jgi:N-acetylmuramic acid 6-phosphate etherase
MTQPVAATERANPLTADLDRLATPELLARIAAQDATVPEAVARELGTIAIAVDAMSERMAGGGRLVYIGAGTSGRLALLEAAEAGPTFSTEPGQVVGIMAGGSGAEATPVESAEDDHGSGTEEIARLDIGPGDVVVGCSASGRTPYAIGALTAARQRGALTISLACDDPTPLGAAADIAIHPLTGPEVIAGSTRLKAGTAQKLVLNMLTTATMVRLGKVYGNLMVDVRAANEKLRRRAERIVAEVTGADPERVAAALEASGWSARLAIAMVATGQPAEEAARRLAEAGGLRALIDGGVA